MPELTSSARQAGGYAAADVDLWPDHDWSAPTDAETLQHRPDPVAAEQRLRKAIDAGDFNAITAAESHVSAAETTTRKIPSMLEAALWYASKGLRVFPLVPGSKRPWPRSHGFEDATTDPDKLRAWFGPGKAPSNLGIATGHVIDVVDIDGIVGQRSRVEHWEKVFERVDGDALAKVLTPRPAGMHIYVPAQGNGNGAGIVRGVDYRGLGGYVVAPPSHITPGGKDCPGTYRFLGSPRLEQQR